MGGLRVRLPKARERGKEGSATLAAPAGPALRRSAPRLGCGGRTAGAGVGALGEAIATAQEEGTQARTRVVALEDGGSGGFGPVPQEEPRGLPAGRTCRVERTQPAPGTAPRALAQHVPRKEKFLPPAGSWVRICVEAKGLEDEEEMPVALKVPGAKPFVSRDSRLPARRDRVEHTWSVFVLEAGTVLLGEGMGLRFLGDGGREKPQERNKIFSSGCRLQAACGHDRQCQPASEVDRDPGQGGLSCGFQRWGLCHLRAAGFAAAE